MNSRVRVIKKENGPADKKERIAYLLLKEETRRQFKLIQEKLLSSLSGCGIGAEEMVSFSASLMKDALEELVGEN